MENTKLADFALSDHNAVYFHFPLISPDPTQPVPLRSCPLNSSLVPQFCHEFAASIADAQHEDRSDVNVEDLVHVFNSSCTRILDSIAPVRVKRSKTSYLPWLNEDLRILKRQCRRAERKWRKDKLSISLASLKQLMVLYQHNVKEARTKYFSNLIDRQGHSPRTLFKTVNS